MNKLILILLFFVPTSLIAQEFDVWKKIEIEFDDVSTIQNYPDLPKVENFLSKGTFTDALKNQEKIFVEAIIQDSYIFFYFYNLDGERISGLLRRPGEITVTRANGNEEIFKAKGLTSGIFIDKEEQDFRKLVQNGNGEELKIYIEGEDFWNWGQPKSGLWFYSIQFTILTQK